MESGEKLIGDYESELLRCQGNKRQEDDRHSANRGDHERNLWRISEWWPRAKKSPNRNLSTLKASFQHCASSISDTNVSQSFVTKWKSRPNISYKCSAVARPDLQWHALYAIEITHRFNLVYIPEFIGTSTLLTRNIFFSVLQYKCKLHETVW